MQTKQKFRNRFRLGNSPMLRFVRIVLTATLKPNQ